MHHIIIKQQTRIQCLDPPKILYFFIMTIFDAPAREKQYQIIFILTKLVQMGYIFPALIMSKLFTREPFPQAKIAKKCFEMFRSIIKCMASFNIATSTSDLSPISSSLSKTRYHTLIKFLSPYGI